MGKKNREQPAQGPVIKKKMRFTQDGYYQIGGQPETFTIPKYMKGQVYEIEGQDMINRWIKRGAYLVDDPPADSPVVVPPTPVPPAPPVDEKKVPVAGDDEKKDDKSKPAPQAADDKKSKSGK